ncbi:MAG TPA: PAS domain S-box protein [Candidatus Acidoferrales bacterium]|jgi:diguanylate cyclase (GGDEF)-like protein/PAS domain S-box-containing protein|nr:PAS domain S-box protein [Candidatus Acidoferrales bacterium]
MWESHAAMALEHANDAIVVCERGEGDPPFVIRYVNAAFERQTGFSRAEALGHGVGILYGPSTNRAAVDDLLAALEEMQPVVGELRKYRKDGTPFWAEVSIRPIAGPDGRLAGSVIVQRDVTERVDAKEELELLSRAIDYARDAIVVFRWDPVDSIWRMRHVNEMFLKMSGYDIADVIGQPSNFLTGELTDMEQLQTFRAALLAGDPVGGDLAFYRKDGSHFWVELSGQGLRDVDGNISHTIIVYRDITEKRQAEERLSFEAAHDALTGAFNRRFFMRAVDDALRQLQTRDAEHGLIFFDLDGFKPINDRYGHEAGDRLLIELTVAIGTRLRDGDVFGRIGGDEFALLLYGCPPDRTETIAHDLLEIVRGFALLWQGHTLRVGASIGAVALDGTAESANDELRRADRACYEAKRAGRDRVVMSS